VADKELSCTFVEGFRHSAPYIHAHRDRTFVLALGGEAVADAGFASLIHDIALLHSLGIRLVLVHGARPQIEQRLMERRAELHYVNGLRITDDAALACVKEAAGTVRVEIEAMLSMGLAHTPMHGARIRVASGNFVTARPLGVRDGVDYLHTGEVRRIDVEGIQQNLAAGRVALLSPLGYSPTGEIFNVNAEEIATATAVALRADKLIMLVEGKGLLDGRRKLIQQLRPGEAGRLLQGRRRLAEDMVRHLESAIHASRRGVRRVHLIGRDLDGALLRELFTRDGCGTLVTDETYEGIRAAVIEDAAGILELIRPMEEEGILVRRSREWLEMEIDRFLVIERDGMIIGCGALYPHNRAKMGELACLAIHPEYRDEGRGDVLLQAVERRALEAGLGKLFVLTTRTAHWFRERGFKPGRVADLPMQKRALYNYQRQSKVFIKSL
jgi:amino-acid N-acetyltransferase